MNIVDNLLKNIFNINPNHLIFFMLIFTRIVIIITNLPLFGSRVVLAIIKISIAFFISIIIYSTLDKVNFDSLNLSISILFLLFLKELVLGFLLSFLFSIIFTLYEMAGNFIDLARGASIAHQLNSHLNPESLILANFFAQMVIVLFFILGLHRSIIESIFFSFEVFNIFEPILIQSKEQVLYMIPFLMADLFKLCLSIALPVIAICFLIDIGFGLLQRIAPQINAYFLSLPAKMIGGLFILWLAIIVIFEELVQNYQFFEGYIQSILKS